MEAERLFEGKYGHFSSDGKEYKITNVHTHPVFSESIFGYNEKCSFGFLQFNTVKRDPELTYKVVSIDNEVVNQLTIRRSQLEFDQ